MADRVLSQEEIDKVFLSRSGAPAADTASTNAQPYDFRRPDRIAKDQLRAIHLLHENFARSLASSLSAYLRTYAVVNLVSVEQLSFMEFSRWLPSPTCLVSLGMKPYEGSAVLEINTGLLFPILEMLLGGNSKFPTKISREITEIEQSVLEGFFRIILRDLKSAWHAVSNMDFTIESYETDPLLLQILSPNEAVIAASMEVRIGDNSGMLNIGIPSIVVKMLRHKFDQQWLRVSESTEEEQIRILHLIKPSPAWVEGRLEGPRLSVEDLIDLTEGDVLTFDYPVERELNLAVNGVMKFRGHVVTSGRKRAFQIDGLQRAVD